MTQKKMLGLTIYSRPVCDEMNLTHYFRHRMKYLESNDIDTDCILEELESDDPVVSLCFDEINGYANRKCLGANYEPSVIFIFLVSNLLLSHNPTVIS